MPYRPALLLLLFAILVTGCAGTRTVSPDDLRGNPFYEVNDAVRGRIAEISLRDGREISAVNLFVLADSTSWYDHRQDRTVSIPTASIEQISVLRTGRAALVGLGVGLVVGTVLGGARAVIQGDDPTTDNLALTEREKLAIYPFAHSAYAVLATTPIGALIGSHDVYRFEPTSSSFTGNR